MKDKTVKFNSHGRPVSDNPENKLYIISSDTDGVLANWSKAILDFINAKDNGHREWEEWKSWKPWELKPPLMTKKEFEDAFVQSLYTPEFYLNLESFPNNGLDECQSYLEEGAFNMYVVTHRANLLAADGIQDSTQLLRRWVEKQGVKAITGVVAGHQDRPELLKQLNVDFHIDDYTEEFERCNEAGIKTYLIDRPWNQDCDAGEYRVKSFKEFLDKTVLSKELKLQRI